MKESRILKILTTTVIVLMILVGVAGTYYYYCQANLEHQQKVNCQKKLASLENQLSAQNDSQDEGCVSLTDEEKVKIGDWSTYNSSLNYSFKYPSDWSLKEDESMVAASGEVNGGETSFQVRVDRATETGFAGFEKDLTKEVAIDCQSVYEYHYQEKGGSQKTIQTNFSQSDRDYLLIFSYQDQAELGEEETLEVYELIRKSFSFNS